MLLVHFDINLRDPAGTKLEPFVGGFEAFGKLNCSIISNIIAIHFSSVCQFIKHKNPSKSVPMENFNFTVTTLSKWKD